MSPNAIAECSLQRSLLPSLWAVPGGDSSFCRQIEHPMSCDSSIRAASRSALPHAMASSQDREDWTERSKCSIYMFFVVVYAFSMHERYRVHDARARQAHARDGRANHGDVVPLRPRHASAISASPRWSVVPRVDPAAPFVSHLPSRCAPPRRNAAKAPQASLLILLAKLLSQRGGRNSSRGGKVGQCLWCCSFEEATPASDPVLARRVYEQRPPTKNKFRGDALP